MRLWQVVWVERTTDDEDRIVLEGHASVFEDESDALTFAERIATRGNMQPDMEALAVYAQECEPHKRGSI